MSDTPLAGRAPIPDERGNCPAEFRGADGMVRHLGYFRQRSVPPRWFVIDNDTFTIEKWSETPGERSIYVEGRAGKLFSDPEEEAAAP
jgi:hypothetical protein